MEQLGWLMKLIDQVSGPAGKIADSLGGTEKAVKNLKETIKAVPAATSALTVGLQQAVAAAEALGQTVIDGGKFALNALAFKESTLASFELMLGTKEAAMDFFNTAKSFGKLTPFETKDVVSSFQQLLQAGFTKTEVPIVFQALGDVSAGRGFDKGIIDRLTLAFGQIRSKGKLMGDDLRQVVEAGVGRGGIFENISKQLGIDPKSVDDVMRAGGVSADVALTAMLDTIRTRFSGGKELGQGMLNQATTLRGLFSTISSAPFDLFLDLDLENSPGFKALKEFASNLASALNPDSATGEGLKSLIGDVLNDIGRGLSQLSLEKMIDGFRSFGDIVRIGFDAVKVFGESVFDVIGPTLELFSSMEGGAKRGEGFVEFMRLAGHFTGAMLNTLLLVVGAVSTAMEGFRAMSEIDFSYLGDQMVEIGKNLMEGLAKGVIGAAGMPVLAIENAAAGAIDAAKSLLGIQSPSKVFEQIGGYTAEGYAQGVSGGQSKIQSSVEGLATARPSGFRGGGQSGPVNITLEINVAGSGDADATARKLAELLPSELASLFEKMALEGGVA